MTNTDEALDRRDDAIERLIAALHTVVEINAATPEATLAKVREIARAALAEAQELLTTNCKG